MSEAKPDMVEMRYGKQHVTVELTGHEDIDAMLIGMAFRQAKQMEKMSENG